MYTFFRGQSIAVSSPAQNIVGGQLEKFVLMLLCTKLWKDTITASFHIDFIQMFTAKDEAQCIHLT